MCSCGPHGGSSSAFRPWGSRGFPAWVTSSARAPRRFLGAGERIEEATTDGELLEPHFPRFVRGKCGAPSAMRLTVPDMTSPACAERGWKCQRTPGAIMARKYRNGQHFITL